MSLSDQIQDVIERSGARIGVALRHIESGEEVMIDADSYFPMASVFKVPVLVEACFRMAQNEFGLGDRWPLKTADKNLPSGVLTFLDDDLLPTVKDLLTLMTIISDNTATDIVVKRLGKEAINKRMRQFGLEHIHIQMTVRELFEELLPNADPTQDLYQLEIDAEKRFDENRQAFRENRVFQLTPENNVATPREMTDLFCHIFAGRTPDRQWSEVALNILLQQQLNERLPRFLPAGTRIAHKTGTLFSIRNDAGIIYARDDSHVAVSVFVLWDEESVEDDQMANWARRFAIDTAMGEIGLLACKAYQ